ncbi:CoA-binding protein [Brevibacillus sp. SYSU BS000544]|uniref:CoA-binding protein n=1 Tax=Brevibacillus sp. SYSU BS000544 TaxID=3416443 RepID=UPI003CE4FD87
MSFQNPSDDVLRQMLADAKTIAVVGCSDKPERTSYLIAEAMQRAGYRIIPVNPLIAGKTVLGETVKASLSEIEEPIDIVNVFRRSEEVLPVAEDAVKVTPTPKVLWLQQGIVNEQAGELAKEHGMNVVMDACIKVLHAVLRPVRS